VSIPCETDHRLLVSVARERSSRADNESQYRSQQVFQQVMVDAVAAAGLDRTGWITQPGGDAELAILPPGPSEAAVVGPLVFAVDRLLAAHNRQRTASVQVRIAIHSGPVHLDGAPGFPGEGIVTVSRLVDAPALTTVLRDFPSANVALIVSGPVYEDAGRPEQFRRVAALEAWIFVPGVDVTH
jgi:class 3 adenylate cyclase